MCFQPLRDNTWIGCVFLSVALLGGTNDYAKMCQRLNKVPQYGKHYAEVAQLLTLIAAL